MDLFAWRCNGCPSIYVCVSPACQISGRQGQHRPFTVMAPASQTCTRRHSINKGHVTLLSASAKLYQGVFAIARNRLMSHCSNHPASPKADCLSPKGPFQPVAHHSLLQSRCENTHPVSVIHSYSRHFFVSVAWSLGVCIGAGQTVFLPVSLHVSKALRNFIK